MEESRVGRVVGAGGYPTVRAGIVFATSAEGRATGEKTTPNNHFGPGPHGGRTRTGIRRVGRAGGCPTIRAWIGPSAGIEIDRAGVTNTAPDDHLTASPDVSTRGSGGWRVSCGGSYPTVGVWMDLPPVFVVSAPETYPPQTIISLPLHTSA